MCSRWQKEYAGKLVAAEEAVRVVKSGDRVAFTHGKEPLALGLALAARRHELKNVRIYLSNPYNDPGWYDPGWEDSFKMEISYVLPVVRNIYEAHRCDFVIGNLTGITAEHPAMNAVDVLFTVVSPPDENGFCSFGTSVWGKKEAIRKSRKVLAEVDENFIRTFGDNAVHVSEIDYFVESLYEADSEEEADLQGQAIGEPGEIKKQIARYVGTLVEDGDTLQIGIGSTSEWLAPLGAFNGKANLGWHSEVTPRGIIRLVREGIINGKYKSINRDKAVAIAIGDSSREDLRFVHNNPMFELYDADYVLDPRIIAGNNKVLAINSALSIDLTGQIAAESLGSRMVGGSGGQLAFAIGAQLSRGGRFVCTLPATASGGNVSRIVPFLMEGTIVTVPRTLADIIVTEYGIARLRGKTQRERAMELISIAHPSFRSELKKKARELYWS